MQNQSPDRLEIFFALALKFGAKQHSSAENIEATVFDDSTNEVFSVIAAHLTEKESLKFKRLTADFQNRTAAEKAARQTEILRQIGTDEPLIDATVHRSHVIEAWHREIPAVRAIIFNFLPPEQRQASKESNHDTECHHRRTGEVLFG